MATRSFDTNTEKEGFERKETYHYNNLNQLVRTDRDTFDVGGDIDAYVTYERDVFGREKVIKVHSDAQGSFELHQIKEYDAYGYVNKVTSYNAQNQVSRIYNSEANEYGREVVSWVDTNQNGKFDGNEVMLLKTLSSVDGRLLSRIDRYANGSADVTVRLHYDQTDLHRATLFDNNNNGSIDKGERYAVRKYFEGSRSQIDSFDYYQGTQDDVAFGILEPTDGLKLVQVQKLHYSDSGQSLGTVYANGERVFTGWSYNGGNGAAIRSSTEDYTDGKFQPLLEQIGGALERINLSNATQSTDIALDNNVLAKLTKSKLTINGDATDTVRLKDNAEFTQIENTKVGSNEYEQYTTEVDGQQYTLLIDTDINVVLA
ncbi:hypothetical protein [Mannheimia sp. E16BA]|uniref:hypothetical protein n=2 Tax=unclassified Mannheimia TaxID=2645054 RepID=UPI00359F1169